ncbi:MAG: transglutaminase domain-containing protein, partial [Chloroflexi bacterium]|nr:transglutaminase domain-containing protein [Chloroflexota bacterium]
MFERLKLEEGWSTFLLLLALMLIVSLAIGATGWAEGLNAAAPVAVLAVLTGMLLARSRFKDWQTTPFVVVYGLFVIGWILGRGLPGDLLWRERVLNLVGRVQQFSFTAISGGTNRDPLMFVIFVCVVTWLMGVEAAWSVFRAGRAWPAAIPPGVALLIVVYYYVGPNQLHLYLLAYLLILLLLVARMSLYWREVEWRRQKVSYDPGFRLDFLRASLAAALLVLSLAWVTPSAGASPMVANVWSQMTGPWGRVRDGWNRLFSSLKSYGQPVNDYYGNSLVLSGAVNNTDRPIMDVAVAPLEGGRYYWRARVFDYYHDGRWETTERDRVSVSPGENRLNFPTYQGRQVVDLTFISYLSASSTLYVAPEVRRVDRPVELEVDAGAASVGAADIASVRSQRILRQGETYTERALVTTADAASLRSAGTDYPQWVRARYLQVPPEITDRTRELAASIIGGQPTPYEAALALTDWLRRNITYNDQRAAAPPGVEPLDHLLFVSREGYCNYYASAMVIMLRSQGIPARMAAGFAEGEYLDEWGVYRVRESDAHAWPEVFFPNYGWVEFEPTVSQLPLVRPQTAASEQADSTAGAAPTPPGGNPNERESRLPDEGVDSRAAGAALQTPNRLWQRIALAAAGALAALALLASAWWMLEYRGLSLRPGNVLLGLTASRLRRTGVALPRGLAWYADRPAGGLSPAALAYGRLIRAPCWLGLAPRASATPYE